MSLVNIHQTQLGTQLAICLHNNSNETIRGICPMYDEVIEDTKFSTNMEYHGSHIIDAGQYTILIIELPKVDTPTSCTIEYGKNRRLTFSFQSSSGYDIDKLKEAFIDSLKPYNNTKLASAIETFKNL